MKFGQKYLILIIFISRDQSRRSRANILISIALSKSLYSNYFLFNLSSIKYFLKHVLSSVHEI